MSGGSMNAGQGKGSRSLKNVAGMLQRGLSFVEVVQDSSHIVELKKRVEVARKGGRLDLAGLALDHVPALALELGNMARVVWLQENLLKEFDPSVIAIWRSLAQLRLSSNLLTVLPPEIGRCRNLSMLFVDSNRLTALPSTISQCKVLTYLNVSNNRIKRLPVSIADIPQLHEFEYDNNPFEFPHKKVF
ncbi:hypothetical protein T484DRAFT_1775972 [Baffinella frigidus]|nr:hypothetical protein T484DRAFT_1775972 [Cryptophyta sp. CCMP2293]